MIRILTENKRKSDIEAELIARGLDFTILTAEGTYKGIREHSLVIEFENTQFSEIRKAAQAIRDMNEQESVWIQCVNSNICEITKDGEQWLMQPL